MRRQKGIDTPAGTDKVHVRVEYRRPQRTWKHNKGDFSISRLIISDVSIYFRIVDFIGLSFITRK